MARIKPTATVFTDLKQVEGALAEMASIERKLTEIQGQMNEEIDAAKERADKASVSLTARHKELASAAKVYATLNQTELFKERKSIDLAFGVIGFQASTEIVQMPNISAETTLERLHSFKCTDAIKVKESILKTAMTGWTDEKLQSVGLKRKKKNVFYLEVKKEALSDALPVQA